MPQQGRAILSLGVRKYESVGRRKKRDELEIASDKKRGDNIIMPFDNSEKRRIFETCYQDNQRRINPLAYWTDSDIWSYSKDVGLEQCGLYTVSYTHLDVYKRQHRRLLLLPHVLACSISFGKARCYDILYYQYFLVLE